MSVGVAEGGMDVGGVDVAVDKIEIGIRVGGGEVSVGKISALKLQAPSHNELITSISIGGNQFLCFISISLFLVK